jgi:hypothetical protein
VHPLPGCLDLPLKPYRSVPRDIFTIIKHDPDFFLSLRTTLMGRLDGLEEILHNTLPTVLHAAQIPFSCCIALLYRL